MWMDTRGASTVRRNLVNDVDNTVKEKRNVWKQQKNGGTKEEYLKSKQSAKTAVHFEKIDAKTEQYASTNNNSHKICILKMTKRLKRDNFDVVGKNVLEMMMES